LQSLSWSFDSIVILNSFLIFILKFSSSPVTPKLIDWSIHFPLKFGKSQKENAITPNNSKFSLNYNFLLIIKKQFSLEISNKISI